MEERTSAVGQVQAVRHSDVAAGEGPGHRQRRTGAQPAHTGNIAVKFSFFLTHTPLTKPCDAACFASAVRHMVLL